MRESFLQKVLLSVVSLGMLGMMYAVYLQTHQAEFKKEQELAALLPAQEKPLQLDLVTKTENCQIQGSLPDHGCSPGAVFPEAAKEKICVAGYTKTVRSVSTSLKKKVFAEYNIAYPQPYGSYEVDHLIPLALGGSNDISNLFPEASNPEPGFKEKDVVENFLHEEVCAGHIALSVAQEQIANDWLVVYNHLDPEVIKDYKAKYPNWANSKGVE